MICNDAEIVVGRNGFKHGNGDGYIVLILCLSLAKNKQITEKNDLPIDVLDHNGKCFFCPMNFLIPAEVKDHEQVNS